jgi:hypothetical protein
MMAKQQPAKAEEWAKPRQPSSSALDTPSAPDDDEAARDLPLNPIRPASRPDCHLQCRLTHCISFHPVRIVTYSADVSICSVSNFGSRLFHLPIVRIPSFPIPSDIFPFPSSSLFFPRLPSSSSNYQANSGDTQGGWCVGRWDGLGD